MIPDFQTLMRPVLESCAKEERKIGDVIEEMSDLFELSAEEREEMLPSGRQARMANRVHWARGYLKQAGLVRPTRRGYIEITEEGRDVLLNGPERITMKYLERFPAYLEFQSRGKGSSENTATEEVASLIAQDATPDEVLASAHRQLHESLSADLLDALRNGTPKFFEKAVVSLLISMGYGGADGRGAVLGGAGDNGVDGVIDKDPLGVDQVYVQAKRYGPKTTVGAGEIRDFFGALSLKDVSRGIFVTSSLFTSSARETAEKLGARIVLIDGPKLADLMITYRVGCRVKETFTVSELDEDFFD